MSYFGTDGIRGEFGVLPITPEFALKLGRVAGQVFASEGGKHVVMGRDTRQSGEVLEAALEAGFSCAGINVHQLGVLPTPGIAHLGRAFGACAAVVISASHNPFHDNGIKFFSGEGKKLDDRLQSRISEALDQPEPAFSARLGHSQYELDALGRYVEFCKSTVPYHLSLKGLKIVIDCAHGAGFAAGPQVLRELGADVIAIGNAPDGVNINEQCGSTHPELLQKTVIREKADLGIALDGDADRVMMVDHLGRLVDGDAILYLLATQRQHNAIGVVGTLMSNMGLELALREQSVDFRRAKVGDRYVMAELLAHGWVLGGEPSGHVLCLDKSNAGDAIIAALQVLCVMVEKGKSLADLASGMSILPQTLVNVRLAVMQDPYADPELSKAFQNAESLLGDRGRLLIRKSGTEPVIRVMVEGESETQVSQLANELADQVRLRLGAA